MNVSRSPSLEPRESQRRILTVGAIEQLLPSITQFIDARFYFFSSLEAVEELYEQKDESLLLKQAQFMASVVDNSFLVFFTRSLEVVCDFLGDDWPVDLRKDELHKLWGPGKR